MMMKKYLAIIFLFFTVTPLVAQTQIGGDSIIIDYANPTQYEVWHELSHFRQFQGIGPEAYGNLSRVQKEQFVFDLLNNLTKRWNGLNFEQQQHAIDYIQRIGGIR